MSPNLNDISLAEEHRRDLLRDAARHQLADSVEPRLRRSRPPYAPLLARLGRLMLAWGSRLTSAYEPSSP